MLYTCYDNSCRYNKFCLIFIRDKDIINISVSYYEDEECWLFLVMTEEMMKEYPALYKKYIISIMLTEDPSRLSGTENIYSIRKRTICENRYITKGYNSKNTYMLKYPVMSYELSDEAIILYNTRIIKRFTMPPDRLIDELIEEESKKIEEDLCFVENEVKMAKITSLYINKIVPENFPDDLCKIIVANVICC
jgi:hypothetical protein